MIYFTPETSKKLGEMGLVTVCERRYEKSDSAFDQAVNMSSILREEYDENMQPMKRLNTLDICELENAKKLWGSEICYGDDGQRRAEYKNILHEYITLTDEERVKYVEDYLDSL